MCGLAGILQRRRDRGASAEVDRALLRRMNDAQRHRGPDGDGFHFEPGIGLAHRRLAIIDIAGGHQPMFNEDGSVAIVFNGEIYNHAGLKQELERLGHVFVSRCDTEVIVHAWESWGPDCLQRLNGMFAIAIWDRNRRCLFLARDRLGKKPIYYADLPDGRFVFASEMAALLAVPELGRKLDAAAVDDFFSLGYIPDPATIYRGVHRLEAAHFLLVEPGDGRPVPRRYWQLSGRAAVVRGGRSGIGARGPSARQRGGAADRRRAAGRVPVGGDRFKHGRRTRRRAARGAAVHLHHRLPRRR